MPTQDELETKEKRRRNYRLSSGDENCVNCEHTANLMGAGLRCCYSPDIQFSCASYMRCDAHAYKKGEDPCH